jgi:hypothetical protein
MNFPRIFLNPYLFVLSYFLSGKLFIQKSLSSGPHLSDATHRAGPTKHHAAAVWPPHATPMPQLKAAVGTARRASRQLPRSPAPAQPRPPRPRHHRPDSCLTRSCPTATASLASVRRRHAPLSERFRTRRCCRAAARAPPPSVLFHRRCRYAARAPPPSVLSRRRSRAAARAPPPSVLPRRQPPPTSAAPLAMPPQQPSSTYTVPSPPTLAGKVPDS